MNKWKIIIAILLVLLIISFIGAFKEGTKCVSNPLVYGAEKASKTDNVEMMCQCSFFDPKYEDFYFTKDEITVGSYLGLD